MGGGGGWVITRGTHESWLCEHASSAIHLEHAWRFMALTNPILTVLIAQNVTILGPLRGL